MKQILIGFFLTGALFITVAITSCGDDPVVDNNYTLSGNANGSQETPPVTTAANGTLSGTYNASTNTLQYAITWTGLSGAATAIHFHGPAVAGASASPIHDLFSQIIANGTSGSAGGSIIIADTTEAHLLNGKIYYNIHTGANPNGEIRGQVQATQ
jgi:hypothetical protein